MVLRTLRDAAKSPTTLAVFATLVFSSLLPAVVDIYASPVYRLAMLPAYLVTMLFYDGGFGLENVVYFASPVAESLLGDGHLLWEAGKVGTFYLFALAVGLLAAALRSRSASNPEPTP